MTEAGADGREMHSAASPRRSRRRATPIVPPQNVAAARWCW